MIVPSNYVQDLLERTQIRYYELVHPEHLYVPFNSQIHVY